VSRVTIQEATCGKWKGILQRFGIAEKFLTNKNCPCPMCDGTDRFRFIDKEGSGSWVCNKCSEGRAQTGTDLVMMKMGWDFKQAADEIRAILGAVVVQEVKKGVSSVNSRKEAAALWNQGAPVTRTDPAGMYLASRVPGLAKVSTALRFCETCKYTDKVSSWHPALLACVTGPDDVPVAVYRTYLTKDGKKAAVESVRRISRGNLPSGSAIRLAKAGKVLGVSEGLETGLSASIIHNIPVWSLMSTANMERWSPPEGVEKVIIFGDNDRNFAGQAAAYVLAKRLKAKPDGPEVAVALPLEFGDWNDTHNK